MGYHRTYRELQINKLVKKNRQSQVALGQKPLTRRPSRLRAEKIVIATGASWNTDGNQLFDARSDSRRRCSRHDQLTPEQGGWRQEGARQARCDLKSDTYFMAPSLAEKLTAAVTMSPIVTGVHLANYMHLTLEYPNPCAALCTSCISKEFAKRLLLAHRAGTARDLRHLGRRLAAHFPGRGSRAARRQQNMLSSSFIHWCDVHRAAFNIRSIASWKDNKAK